MEFFCPQIAQITTDFLLACVRAQSNVFRRTSVKSVGDLITIDFSEYPVINIVGIKIDKNAEAFVG